ncbi:MAG: putative inorganic carbon transporter subunit DabA [Gammaproteobacteria bacterium]
MNDTVAVKPKLSNVKEMHSVNYKIENQRVAIRAMVNNASKEISPVWPLENFIAFNPLHGFQSMPFEQALLQKKTAKKTILFNENLEKVNWHVIKWCGSFLDIGQGTIEMPHRDKGLFVGFLKLAQFDIMLHQNNKTSKEWLSSLPSRPEDTILICLHKLFVSTEKHEEFIKDTLSYLPGWAGYIKWMSEWKANRGNKENPISLTDFLAIRLVITCLVWPDAAKEKKKIISKAKKLFN